MIAQAGTETLPGGETAGLPRRLLRLLAFPLKLLLGVLLCLTPVTAVLVLGWLQRLMQREVHKTWHRRSDAALQGRSFQGFALAMPESRRWARWPNWIWREDAGAALAEAWTDARSLRGLLGVLGGALWDNLRLGLQSLLTLSLLLLPWSVLWLLGWWGGWENSFNKGYEQAAVGPVVCLIGVAGFVLAMMYLPLALARQAASGSWRSAFQHRIVRALLRRRRLACLGLALLYGLFALPLFALRGLPVFVENWFPGFVALGPAEIEDFRGQLIFWASAYLFGALIVLRLAAARIYAGALLRALGDGEITPQDLAPPERDCLARLDLLPAGAPAPQGRGLLRRLPRAPLVLASAAVWTGIAFLVFFGQFLNHAWILWLNHPLIQLPWLLPLGG